MEQKQSKFKVVVCGNYGATNVGDEAVLAGVLQILKRFFKADEIAVLSYNPNETRQQHGVEAYYLLPFGIRSLVRGILKGEWQRTSRVIKEAEYFVVGGGTLFTDEWWLPVFLWGMHVRKAFQYKRKVIFLGGGVGPLRKRCSRFIVRRLFRKMDLILVRDKATRMLLMGLGIENVWLTGDTAFLLENFREQKSESYVILSLRDRIKKVNNWAKIWGDLIDRISHKYGVKFILVPFQKIRGEDCEIVNKIFEQVERKNAVKIQEFSSDWRVVLRLFCQAKMVIGMRLHALIFAFLAGVPMIGLSYSQKVQSLMRDAELEKQVIDLADFDEKKLEALFQKTWERREELQKILRKKSAYLQEQVQLNEVYLEEYFKKSGEIG